MPRDGRWGGPRHAAAPPRPHGGLACLVHLSMLMASLSVSQGVGHGRLKVARLSGVG